MTTKVHPKVEMQTKGFRPWPLVKVPAKGLFAGLNPQMCQLRLFRFLICARLMHEGAC